MEIQLFWEWLKLCQIVRTHLYGHQPLVLLFVMQSFIRLLGKMSAREPSRVAMHSFSSLISKPSSTRLLAARLIQRSILNHRWSTQDDYKVRETRSYIHRLMTWSILNECWRSLPFTFVQRGGHTDTNLNFFEIVTEALLGDTCQNCDMKATII